jgi:hypothetical protein
MNVLNRLGVGFVLLIVFVFFQFLGATGNHISLSFLEDKEPADVCTLMYVNAVGFPFRSNLYDACDQDGTPIAIVQLVNYALQIAALALLYHFLSSRLAKKPKSKV